MNETTQNASAAVAAPTVVIPENLASVTVVDSAPEKPVFGVNFLEFEYRDKGYKIDTALLVGKSNHSLMSLNVYATLCGVSKSKQPEAFRKLAADYNMVHKPAFWALHNATVEFARTHLEVRSVGLRQRSDGRVSASATWLSKKQESKPAQLGTEAGRFIADGTAKQQQQSKAKAKRQGKGKQQSEPAGATVGEQPAGEQQQSAGETPKQ